MAHAVPEELHFHTLGTILTRISLPEFKNFELKFGAGIWGGTGIWRGTRTGRCDFGFGSNGKRVLPTSVGIQSGDSDQCGIKTADGSAHVRDQIQAGGQVIEADLSRRVGHSGG